MSLMPRIISGIADNAFEAPPVLYSIQCRIGVIFLVTSALGQLAPERRETEKHIEFSYKQVDRFWSLDATDT